MFAAWWVGWLDFVDLVGSRVLARLVLNLAWLAALVLAFRTEGLLTAVAGADVSARAVAIAENAFRITVVVLASVTATLVATDTVRLVRR